MLYECATGQRPFRGASQYQLMHAILNDRVSGFHNTYFSGAGLLASLNGPWSNSLIRGEIGVPVVSHGIHGVVVSVTMLKLF